MRLTSTTQPGASPRTFFSAGAMGALVLTWLFASLSGGVPAAARVSPPVADVRVAGTRFAPQACMRLPTDGPALGSVFLDAGHGGSDTGASSVTSDGRAVSEERAALAVVRAAALRLQAAGYEVVVSRWGDTGVAAPAPGVPRGRTPTPPGPRSLPVVNC